MKLIRAGQLSERTFLLISSHFALSILISEFVCLKIVARSNGFDGRPARESFEQTQRFLRFLVSLS